MGKAVNTPFNSGQLVAGQLCRTILRNRTLKQCSTDGQSMSLTDIQREVNDIFQDDASLDTQKELNQLAGVLHSVVSGPDDCELSRMDFLNCCTRQDIAMLSESIKLFDMDRRPSCLEALFDTERSSRLDLMKGAGKLDATPGGRPTAQYLRHLTSAGPPQWPEEDWLLPPKQEEVKHPSKFPQSDTAWRKFEKNT